MNRPRPSPDVDAYIRALVAAAPPLTKAQRAWLAPLFRPPQPRSTSMAKSLTGRRKPEEHQRCPATNGDQRCNRWPGIGDHDARATYTGLGLPILIHEGDDNTRWTKDGPVK